MDAIIKKSIKGCVPHFFMYAKDKKEEQVEPINDSFVNRLENMIPDFVLRFSTSTYGTMSPDEMMQNPDISVDMRLVSAYRLLNAGFRNRIQSEDRYSNNSQYIVAQCKERLSSFGYSDDDITDMLVRALYFDTDSQCKDLLWTAYGDVLLRHIQTNLAGKQNICTNCGQHFEDSDAPETLCRACRKKSRSGRGLYDYIRYRYVGCCDCGVVMKLPATNHKTYRCEKCQKEYRKKYKAAMQAAYRERRKQRVDKSNP